MKKYMHRGVLHNIGFLLVGAGLFFSSFVVGESTLIGGIMHLSGCAFFCCGVHKKWHKLCEDDCSPSKSKFFK